MKELIILCLIFYCLGEPIVIPEGCCYTNYREIKTELGPIYYQVDQYKTYEADFSGLKNTDLYTPHPIYPSRIYIKPNDIVLVIRSEGEYLHSVNLLHYLILDMLYQTKYISKKIYSIDKEYMYFGKTPKLLRIIQNLPLIKLKL